jgi:hypothetical protein
MFATAAARSGPSAIALSPTDLRLSVLAAGAGDGVTGGFCVVEVEGTGAGGTAGVCTVAGAGVDGAAVLDWAAGAGFGWTIFSFA